MGKLFGEYIRKRREGLLADDNRFTIRKVADRIRVHHSYLSKIERGEPGTLSVKKVVALACELGEDPDLLLAMNGRISDEMARFVFCYPELFRALLNNLKLHCAGGAGCVRSDEDFAAMIARINGILSIHPGGMLLHELQAPIAGIVADTETVLARGGLEDEMQTLLLGVRDGARRMLDTVAGALDLSKIEAGAYSFQAEEVNLVTVIGEVWQDLQWLASRRNIGLRMELNGDPLAWGGGESVVCGSLLASGSERLCRSMLVNLLKNALEAEPEGGMVTVRLSCAHGCVVEVHNQGVVPELIRDGFFKKYTTHGKKDGVGLGTYSAKLMAEVQGGSVALHTDDGSGTTLTVRLPSAE